MFGRYCFFYLFCSTNNNNQYEKNHNNSGHVLRLCSNDGAELSGARVRRAREDADGQVSTHMEIAGDTPNAGVVP